MSTINSKATSLAGIMEATITIFVTTLDDSLFLVPLVAQAGTPRLALFHGMIFVVTMEALSIVICLLAVLLQVGLTGNDQEKTETILEATGAGLCWCLAGFYYYKAWAKKRARSLVRRLDETTVQANQDSSQQHATTDELEATTESPVNLEMQNLTEEFEGDGLVRACDDAPESIPHLQNDSIQAWTIISLTCAGSLDEMSYFSGLIIANVFTPLEICLGTLIASLAILVLIDMMVRQCQRCLQILDQIPLYAVISVFALMLTVDLVWDLVS